MLFLAAPLVISSLVAIPQASDTGHGARIARALAAVPAAVVIRGESPVRSTLEERMRRYGVPGTSIAVAVGGRIVWAAGFGVKAADEPDGVTSETLFQAASISKPVAATAMLRLVEKGILDLDADVNRYLRTWKVPANGFTALAPVTLRRIVSHSAGLTVSGFPGYPRQDSLPTLQQILSGERPANTGPIAADTIPGAIERYSGGGTTVMQLLLEDVTGRAFPDLLRELVLEPAGMARSAYAQPLPAARHHEAATGHFATGQPRPTRWHTYPELAAAGLWTTPSDVLRWAGAITASWRGEPGSLLSQATARQMLTRVKAGFGLGPGLDGEGDALRFGHGGSNAGFRCVVWYFPALDAGVAVMTNGDAGGLVIGGVLRALAREYGWPAFQPREVTAAILDEASLRAVAGEYGGTGNQPRLTVTLEEGRVYAVAPGILPREGLVPISTTDFLGMETALEIRFRLEGDRVVAVSLAGRPELLRRP
jgi:CubicO group peptidase (beta-lactamase class C family)